MFQAEVVGELNLGLTPFVMFQSLITAGKLVGSLEGRVPYISYFIMRSFISFRGRTKA